MRITRVEAVPVRVPLKEGLTTKTAHGEHVVSPYVIVRVHTGAGLTGKTDMPGLTGPEVEALYATGAAWLAGA